MGRKFVVLKVVFDFGSNKKVEEVLVLEKDVFDKYDSYLIDSFSNVLWFDFSGSKDEYYGNLFLDVIDENTLLRNYDSEDLDEFEVSWESFARDYGDTDFLNDILTSIGNVHDFFQNNSKEYECRLLVKNHDNTFPNEFIFLKKEIEKLMFEKGYIIDVKFN